MTDFKPNLEQIIVEIDGQYYAMTQFSRNVQVVLRSIIESKLEPEDLVPLSSFRYVINTESAPIDRIGIGSSVVHKVSESKPLST